MAPLPSYSIKQERGVQMKQYMYIYGLDFFPRLHLGARWSLPNWLMSSNYRNFRHPPSATLVWLKPYAKDQQKEGIRVFHGKEFYDSYRHLKDLENMSDVFTNDGGIKIAHEIVKRVDRQSASSIIGRDPVNEMLNSMSSCDKSMMFLTHGLKNGLEKVLNINDFMGLVAGYHDLDKYSDLMNQNNKNAVTD